MAERVNRIFLFQERILLKNGMPIILLLFLFSALNTFANSSKSIEFLNSETSLSNIENVGIADALTGPIARGDAAVVERHLAEMESKTPELVTCYKLLGNKTIAVAREKGTLLPDAEILLKKLFK